MNLKLQVLKNSYLTILVIFLLVILASAHEINGSSPKRIISLSPSITEILFEIGSGNQVIAVDNLSNYPNEAPITDISAYDPNVEAISLLNPDLVILSYNIKNLKAALKKIGIETIYLPAPLNFEDILDQIDYLGLQTGNEDKAKKLISKMKNRMKTLQKLRENEKATKIYHEIDPNYYSPSKFSFIGDIYQKLNYKNVADKADISNLGYPKLSPELIISENPDLIVLPGKDNKYVEKVKLRPGWGYIEAVKKNNFLLTNNDIASRWGPRILNFASILVEYSKK
jgi:iron complex transport system substrate-binding protein|tara:strand:- start:1551 stop:2402 length:852 start_codon:yes stop_codon:yes gene_type:complete